MFKKNFLKVPTGKCETSKGPVTVPCLFTDGSAVMAFYLSDYDAVLSKLDGTDFVPLKIAGGKAFTVLGFFDYRDSSFGPYKEVTLMFPVLPEDSADVFSVVTDLFRSLEKRKIGNYMIDLPVTSELPLAAGRELWGYPKFMADIRCGYEDGKFSAAVNTISGSTEILHFECPFGGGFPSIMLSSISYTCLNDSVRRSVVSMNSSGRITSGSQARLSVGAGDHRMIRNIKDLEIEGTRPAFVQTTAALQYILHESKIIKECRTPSLPYADKI